MCSQKSDNSVPTATSNVAGDAVGVERPYWYVAIVNNNREKSISKRLTDLGIENYVPTQKEIRVRGNGRKAAVERVVIPCKVFIRCTPRKRRQIVEYSFINRFMTDRTATLPPNGIRPLATIPDRQMDTLRFMLGQSDISVEIAEGQYRPGDKVRVIRGKLQGLEGTVRRIDDRTSLLLVHVDFIGTARLHISPADVQPIKDES